MIELKRVALVVAGLMAVTPLLSAQDKAPPKRSEGKPPPPQRAPGKTRASGKAANGAGGIETAVLVLDASGSMSGSVDGIQKMAAAKEAVGQLISGWDKTVPLGLTVYGHRTGSCTDIESLIAVGPVDATQFMTSVNGLTPTGSTPLTAAVIQAAEQLDYEHNQATVILVSDGEESCGGDPCEMAKQLEAMGVDFTAHVVGFGVTDDTIAAGLSCIATNTGGQYKTAANAAELKAALGGMVKDVETRKVKWRKRWGKRWGKNGRWNKGRWNKGRGDGHQQMWNQHWDHWKKTQAKRAPGKTPPRKSRPPAPRKSPAPPKKK